jgi:hypothetical protein
MMMYVKSLRSLLHHGNAEGRNNDLRDRVAVGLHVASHVRGGKRGAAARLIVDDDGLAKMFARRVGKGAHEQVA